MNDGSAPGLVTIFVSAEKRAALEPPAIKRGMTVQELVEYLVSTVSADPSLIDAILDDEE